MAVYLLHFDRSDGQRRFPTEFEIMNWKQVAGMALAE